jgi:hypothetical protein
MTITLLSHRILPAILVVAMALTMVLAAPAAAQAVFPPVIPLPDGFQPEGIAVGNGTTFFVGSIPTGMPFTAATCALERVKYLSPSRTGAMRLGSTMMLAAGTCL